MLLSLYLHTKSSWCLNFSEGWNFTVRQRNISACFFSLQSVSRLTEAAVMSSWTYMTSLRRDQFDRNQMSHFSSFYFSHKPTGRIILPPFHIFFLKHFYKLFFLLKLKFFIIDHSFNSAGSSELRSVCLWIKTKETLKKWTQNNVS